MSTTIMNLVCQNKTCANEEDHRHGTACYDMCSTCHGIDWTEKK